MGYLLPWGQMSFWGAQVIINLFSAIPVIQSRFVHLDSRRLRRFRRYLNRFFALHVIAVPLGIARLGCGAHHRPARSGF